MNPIPQLLGCLVVFLGLLLGLGLPLVAAAPLTPPEKVCAGAAVGVVLLYLFALVHYWLNLPVAAFGLPPLAALVLLGVRRHACLAVLRDPAARRLLGAYLLAAGWSLGFLALVRSYSGGNWTLDWVNHYQRSLLFLEHWSPRHPLSGSDVLPTRPPLANAVTAVFLALTSADFACFQIFTTLASSLAFLPGWLFAGRFGPQAPRAQAVLTVLFMLNPSVVENSTFAWTKLVTVFFVLTGTYFFLPALVAGSRRRLAAVFVFLAAGLLAHYSAGPYAVAIVVAYCWWRRANWWHRRFWQDTALCALPAALLLATWFVWSLREFGAAGTFLTNAAVTQTPSHAFFGFARDRIQGLFQTLVPHPLRAADYGQISQASRLGFMRDYFFLIYQTCLPTMFGSVSGMVLLGMLWRAWRERRRLPTPTSSFWAWFVLCSVGFAAVASGGTDPWGRAHLCLQSFVGLGLAFLAARLVLAPRWLRVVVSLGVLVDFILGIILQFYLEHLPHSLPEVMRDGGYRLVTTFGGTTFANLVAKWYYRFEFIGDWPIYRPVLIALLGCLLLLAGYRCARSPEKTTGKIAAVPGAPGGEPSIPL